MATSKYDDISYFESTRIIYVENTAVEPFIHKVQAIRHGARKIKITYADELEVSDETISLKQLQTYGWTEELQKTYKQRYKELASSPQESFTQTQPTQLTQQQSVKITTPLPVILHKLADKITSYGIRKSIHLLDFGKIGITRQTMQAHKEIEQYLAHSSRRVFYVVNWRLKSNSGRVITDPLHKFGIGFTIQEVYRHDKRNAQHIVVGSNIIPIVAHTQYLIIWSNTSNNKLMMGRGRRHKQECFEALFKYIVRGTKGTSQKTHGYDGLSDNMRGVNTTEHFNLPSEVLREVMYRLAPITENVKTWSSWLKLWTERYKFDDVMQLLFPDVKKRMEMAMILTKEDNTTEVSATQAGLYSDEEDDEEVSQILLQAQQPQDDDDGYDSDMTTNSIPNTDTDEDTEMSEDLLDDMQQPPEEDRLSPDLLSDMQPSQQNSKDIAIDLTEDDIVYDEAPQAEAPQPQAQAPPIQQQQQKRQSHIQISNGQMQTVVVRETTLSSEMTNAIGGGWVKKKKKKKQ